MTKGVKLFMCNHKSTYVYLQCDKYLQLENKKF